MVFQANKELLLGVGRRDFELGSAPVFPVARVEIDLEEWRARNTRSVPLRVLHIFLKKKKTFSRFLLSCSYFRAELRETRGGVSWNGAPWEFRFGENVSKLPLTCT